MTIFFVQALVSGEWLEWMVLAADTEAAIAATGCMERPGINHMSVSVWPAAQQAWVLQAPPSQGASK